MQDALQHADQAAAFLRSRWKAQPKFGIVLGTGSGALAEQIAVEYDCRYGEIPNFPSSTALGHAGKLVCGTLAGQDIIAMQGRFHLYEGYEVDQATLPIHVMQRLGVEILFISNAAGGMNPQMASGNIMLIDSHMDFMYRSTPQMAGMVCHQRPMHLSDSYDRELMAQAKSFARSEGITLHQGVYAALLGPNYETRAEYRFLKKMGADVAGMSTVPEVAVASRYGIRVLGMSIITNVAIPDNMEQTSGEEVINAAQTAADSFQKIVLHSIQRNA